MTEKYTERLRHKADRLAQISAELDALHAQACAVLGDAHEGVLLGQLSDTRRALAAHLPTAQVAASEAEGHTSAATDYLNRVYRAPAQAGRQGGQS
jgi:hypothetical protein